MLEAKNIEIDGIQFQLNPLKGFKAIKLDKKVVGLLIPLFKGLKDFDSELDLGKSIDGIGSALDSMKEDEFEKFTIDLLSTTIILIDGKPPMEIDKNVIDTEFQGNTIIFYKLLFEVMKYNKFSPFVLASGGGSRTLKTLISSALK